MSAGVGARRVFGRFVRAVFVAGLLVGAVGLAERAGAQQSIDSHRLRWFVHVDLVDPGSGRDLLFWQNVIDQAMALSNEALEGRNGPADRACCTHLSRPAAVATFGNPGDGRDVLDSLAEQNFFNTNPPAGSNAYLIDSITYCGGSAPGTIGCAERPSCNGNGNDNPDLWMVVTVDAFDNGILPPVVAHERGHNTCLQHVAVDECQIMQASVFAPGLSSCLTTSECTNYRAGRTTTASGGTCACHPAAGGIAADGELCSTAPLGLCSGGLCEQSLASAVVRPIAAAAPGTAAGGPPDDALGMSTVTGHWSILGQFAPTADDVRGLEFAHDSGILFGIVPTVADDRLVTIDPASGAILTTVATYANGSEEFAALAYDPGETEAASDDRLLVLEAAVGGIGELRAIDPANPNVASLVGSITISPSELITGLAYDSVGDRLYLATPFFPDGLYRMNLAGCSPPPCELAQVSGAGLFREDASLSFSPTTGKLYLVGTLFDGQRTFYDVVDPATGASEKTLSLDVFTPAGLAVVPEPFGAFSIFPGVLGVIVAYRARHGSIPRSRG